jgi:hypothetical protein
MTRTILRSVSVAAFLSLILALPPSPTVPAVSANATPWIEVVWVNSSNNLYVRINGDPDYYRLHVRRVGATFGNPPHFQYY